MLVAFLLFGAGIGTGPSEDMKGQLYNIKDDPCEVYNLIDWKADKVAELRGLVETFQRDGRSTPRADEAH